MTLKNAQNHLEKLASETNKKSELKVYLKFIQVISNLRKKDLSEIEIQSIETKLDELELQTSTTNNKRNYSKALRNFKKFIKDKFSFTVKGYFTESGIAFGSAFGIIFGNMLIPGVDDSSGVALGVAIGSAIGLMIGSYLDKQAEAAGKIV